MKIQLCGDGHKMSLVLPTRMILSKTVLHLVSGSKYAPEVLANIPAETVESVFAELRRIKRVHGSWELVDIESSDGDSVKITS